MMTDCPCKCVIRPNTAVPIRKHIHEVPNAIIPRLMHFQTPTLDQTVPSGGPVSRIFLYKSGREGSVMRQPT